MTEQDKINFITHQVCSIMNVLGIPQSDSTKETPMRVAKMFVNELFSNVGKEPDIKMTLFDNPSPKKLSPILIKGIPFSSMCEHHLLPFTGVVDVEYIPSEKIVGLSKIPRVVDWFSRMPQVQEKLTSDIGEYLVKTIKPRFLRVTVRDVKHMCVSMRGIEKECTTDTEFEWYIGEE